MKLLDKKKNKKMTAKLRGKRNDNIYIFFFTWIKLSVSQFERRLHYYCYYLVILRII